MTLIAADRLHVPVYELENMSIVWRDRAILARTAESEAEHSRQEREIALAQAASEQN